MKAYDKQAAYQAVMARIREKVELPPNRAPQSWLAEQLGVTRQLSYVWQEKGIPESHAEEIAKLLDMDPALVCPSLLVTYVPEPVIKEIIASSTKKKPFSARLIELIKNGFRFETNEPFPGKRKSAPLTKDQSMKPIGGFIPISAEELANQRQEALKAGADLSVKGRAK